ncbi:MAG: hypothetical protein ACTSSI_05125 [Candidatus Helarchaeota archaeon]
MNSSWVQQGIGKESSCNICNERVATYYCNNCNVILCSRCVEEEKKKFLYCMKCGTKIMQDDLQNKSSKIKCRTCKSTALKEGISNHKMCPSCRHVQIVSIAGKNRSFVEEFRSQIMTLMHAHDSLQEVQQKMRILKRTLIKLRSAAFLHDYQLETYILEVLNALPLYKERLLVKLAQKMPLLQQQVQKLNYTESWAPQNFAYYDTILNQIKDTITTFRAYVDDLLRDSKEKLTYVSDAIHELISFKDKFSTILPIMTLLPEELPIAMFDNVKIKECTLARLNSQKGSLVLTDQRLIFIQKKGIFFSDLEVTFEMFLDGLEKMSMVGHIFKRLQLETDRGLIKFAAKKTMHDNILKYFEIASNFSIHQVSDKLMATLMDASETACDLNELKEKIEQAVDHLQNIFDQSMTQASVQATQRQSPYIQNPISFQPNQNQKAHYFTNNPVSRQFNSVPRPPPMIRSQESTFNNHVHDEIGEMLLNLQKRKILLEEDLKTLERKISGDPLDFLKRQQYRQKLQECKNQLQFLNQKIKWIESKLQYTTEEPVTLPIQFFE